MISIKIEMSFLIWYINADFVHDVENKFHMKHNKHYFLYFKKNYNSQI